MAEIQESGNKNKGRQNKQKKMCIRDTESKETAVVRYEEGGDDVKSARPLRPGLHTCYNGGYIRQLHSDVMLIPKASLSSDWSLQPDSMKLDSLDVYKRQGE